MDGLPGFSAPAIEPGETFTDRFPVAQRGTYWYHSHSKGQQQGVFGPRVVEPAGAETNPAERDSVVLLPDWRDEEPMTIGKPRRPLSRHVTRG